MTDLPDSHYSAIPAVVATELKSRNNLRRAEACRSLENLAQDGSEQAIELLIHFLGDDHPRVRSKAGECLAQLPVELVERRLLDALSQMQEERRPGHRTSLLHALGMLDLPCHSQICRALVAELGHGDSDVRFQALSELNRIGCHDQSLISMIPELIQDPDQEVAAVAASTAVELELTQCRQAIVERWRSASESFAIRQLAIAAAWFGAEEVIPTLERCAKSSQDAIEALEALIHLGTEESKLVLHQLARRWRVHPVIKSRAAVGLVELGHPDGANQVERCLAHRKHTLRRSAMDWLGQTKRSEYAPRLEEIAKQPDHPDREEAQQALDAMTEKD